MLINVKMPTFVGILTIISMINTISESSKKVYATSDDTNLPDNVLSVSICPKHLSYILVGFAFAIL